MAFIKQIRVQGEDYDILSNIPAQDTAPTEGDLWIDTSENGEEVYSKVETDAKIDEKISEAFANIAHAEGGSF